MANREACEVYIEQEIRAGLEAGKKPWTIGKELSGWVEKLFEVTINPQTIKSRAIRMKETVCSNEQKKSQPTETVTHSIPQIIENRKPQGGGAREGAGRPLKHKVNITPVSHAFEFASMAICQLDKILPNDPQKKEALNQVIEYCKAREENDR